SRATWTTSSRRSFPPDSWQSRMLTLGVGLREPCRRFRNLTRMPINVLHKDLRLTTLRIEEIPPGQVEHHASTCLAARDEVHRYLQAILVGEPKDAGIEQFVMQAA